MFTAILQPDTQPTRNLLILLLKLNIIKVPYGNSNALNLLSPKAHHRFATLYI
jgi:hypothetical protein